MKRFPNILIRASAGTGKTFQLANRFIGLLHAGAAPDEILASTFTKKAAGEILDRVMLRLALAASDDASCADLAGHVDATIDTARCRELLQMLVQNLHRLRICTLDSFFSQLAGSFTLELGLPAGWNILESIHDAQLRSQAIERILQEDEHGEVYRLMMLMTKGDTNRSVSSLIHSAVDAMYDLYLETEPEAWEQFPKLRPLSAEKRQELFEAFRTMDVSAKKSLANAHAKAIDDVEREDWDNFIKRGLGKPIAAGETIFNRKPIPADVFEVYAALLQHVRATFIETLAHQTKATRDLLHRFDGTYRQLKHEARGLRFADVTARLAKAAMTDVQQQHFRLDARISHLLLDEFQDTSLGQWQVLRPFAERVTSADDNDAAPDSGCGSSFFCVGDVKQAIYAWRGGRAEIFDALEGQLNDLSKESLTQSYRSAPPIIDAVNEVFTKVTRHPKLEKLEPAVKQWCDRFTTHSTARQELPGYVRLVTAPVCEDGQKQRDLNLTFAAGLIAERVQQAPGRSVGVLAQTNGRVATLIYELRRLGVAASEEGGSPLNDSAAVQLILSLLKLADHPGDGIARFHLASSPFGKRVGLASHDDDTGAAELAGKVRDSLIAFGYGPTVYAWSEKLAPECDARDRRRLQQLVELAYNFQSIASLRTRDFLRYVKSERVADPTTADVRVMTIHKAKGLQFDVVVLPDLDGTLVGQRKEFVCGQSDPAMPIERVCVRRKADIQALLPDDLRALFDNDTLLEMTEEMCALYVALTRAVHCMDLVISPSGQREKSLHKTWAGLLRAALTDGAPTAPEQVLYETGDPQWYTRLTPPASIPEPQPVRQVQLAEGLPTTAIEQTSPSRLEGGRFIKLRNVLETNNTAALARGDLFHAWFEQIQWLDEGLPERELLREVARRRAPDSIDVEQELDTFYASLSVRDVTDTLRRRFYQPVRNTSLASAVPAEFAATDLDLAVYNERSFVVRDGHQLLSGFIDRLVLLRHDGRIVAADVVDYKTDKVDAADPPQVEQRVEHYRPQLQAYRRAVAKMCHLSTTQVSARLLFVSAGIVRVISPSVDE